MESLKTRIEIACEKAKNPLAIDYLTRRLELGVDEGICGYFIQRKKRFCSHKASAGSNQQYCWEHSAAGNFLLLLPVWFLVSLLIPGWWYQAWKNLVKRIWILVQDMMTSPWRKRKWLVLLVLKRQMVQNQYQKRPQYHQQQHQPLLPPPSACLLPKEWQILSGFCVFYFRFFESPKYWLDMFFSSCFNWTTILQPRKQQLQHATPTHPQQRFDSSPGSERLDAAFRRVCGAAVAHRHWMCARQMHGETGQEVSQWVSVWLFNMFVSK